MCTIIKSLAVAIFNQSINQSKLLRVAKWHITAKSTKSAIVQRNIVGTDESILIYDLS